MIILTEFAASFRCAIPRWRNSMTITRTRKLGLVAAALVTLGLSATSASAEGFFHHPRQAQVNAPIVHRSYVAPWQAHRHFRFFHERRAMARYNGYHFGR